MSLSRHDCSPPGAPERATTRAAFFVLGVGVSAWATLVPYAKARLVLDEADLGLLLLCVGVGSLVAMPFAGTLTGRFGCRKVLLASLPVFLGVLPLLASVESTAIMALCLLVFGASMGLMDVALNIQSVFVEQAAGKPLMSGFHGLYSVGGAVGAGGMVVLLGLMPPLYAVGVACAALVALLAAYGRHFIPYGSGGGGPLFVVPRGIVLLIGVLCFIMYLGEGTILDWSALFMTVERGVEPSRAGLAYGCFSVTMVLGRLFGDRIVQRFGDARILFWGSLCRRRIRRGDRRAVGVGVVPRLRRSGDRRVQHRPGAVFGHGPPDVHAPEPRHLRRDHHRLQRRPHRTRAHGLRGPCLQPVRGVRHRAGHAVLRGGGVQSRALAVAQAEASGKRLMRAGCSGGVRHRGTRPRQCGRLPGSGFSATVPLTQRQGVVS